MPSLRPTILSYLEDHVAKRLANHKTTSGDIPINRAINDILDRPENRECIKEHIEKLAERTLASRAAFEKISSLLRLFDSKKYRTKDGHDIPTLHPTWDELRKEYDELLKKSRHDAIILKAVCDDYVQGVVSLMDEEGVSVEDIKEELRYFVQRTEVSEIQAQFRVDDFEKLKSGVESHKKLIEDSFTSADEDVGARIDELQLSISELKSQIAQCQQIIRDWLTAAKLGEGLVAVGMVLVNWCPPVAALVAVGLLTMGTCKFIAHRKELKVNSLMSKLRTQEEKVAKLIAGENETLKELMLELVASAGPFENIITQLCALSEFWKSVKADCRSAIEHLNKVETTQMITQYGLKVALGDRFAASVYITLSQTLALYASRVTVLE